MTTALQTTVQPASSNQALTVAIVGATGAVGQEFLQVLAERNFPIGRLKLLASARSAGKEQSFNGQTIPLEELTEESFHDVDLALFSAGGSISKHYAPIAVEAGATVVDNSSAFRMTEGVPLVVPEVNGNATEQAGLRLGQKPGIVANPNCSTIIMVVPIRPLHQAAGIQRVVVSTYQAASGGGAAAMAELEQQTRQVLAGESPTQAVFSQQCAFNLFSHDSAIGPEGYNGEEMKMLKETRKIFGVADERELGVTQHFVYYPYGAPGEGHVGEIVALLDRRADGEPVDIRVFPETSVVDKAGGEFHVLEEGRGTGYLNDLIQPGCPVPEWEEYRGLFRAFRWHAEA
jgi:aspartate-semialdehyde dehydrogenase